MLTIGITGSEGLIGWHISSYLRSMPELEIVRADRSTFLSDTAMKEFVVKSDVIIHLAGMNRGDDQEVYDTNVSLTAQLINACEQARQTPHVIFASSTHIYRETPYGASKRKCAEMFEIWAKRAGAKFTNLIMPHIFGEHGRPFYNSVVSTFCYQLARGETPTVTNDTQIELVHAQQVAREVLSLINTPKVECRIKGLPITVTVLRDKLALFADLYKKHMIPDLRDSFALNLFNTYRSYLYPDYYPVKSTLHEDNRGNLFEAVKSINSGQCFISTTKPGITRGNHYHLNKVERFFVLRGQAVIRVRKLYSLETQEFTVSGENPQYIDIPTMHTHNITNVGSGELLTLFWAHEIFDPQNPDTYGELV